MLTEEVISSGTAAETRPAARRASASRYTEAASYERRTRLTDTLPSTLLARGALWLIAAAVLSGLLLLDRYAQRLAETLPADSLATLQLGSYTHPAHGSLIAWIASGELILAAYLSLVIYSIRRHRSDDYHGKYRLWLWAGGIWLLMSANTIASLDRLLLESAAHLEISSTAARAALLWGPLAIVWSILLWRLAVEVNPCRSALAGLSAAFFLWAGALALSRTGSTNPNHATAMHNIPLAFVASYLLLVASLIRYAGHVVRDADGQLSCQQTKPEGRGRRVREQSADVDSPAAPPAQLGRSAATKPAPAADGAGDAEPKTAGRAVALAVSVAEQAEKNDARRHRPRGGNRWNSESENADRSDEETLERQSHRITRSDRKKLRKEKDRLRHAA